jgi:hypothetical protein
MNIELANPLEYHTKARPFFAEIMEALTGSADPTAEQTAAVFGRPMTWATCDGDPRNRNLESFDLHASLDGCEEGRLHSVTFTRFSSDVTITVTRYTQTDRTASGWCHAQKYKTSRVPATAKQWAKALAKVMAA